jgi:hypothetical protein
MINAGKYVGMVIDISHNVMMAIMIMVMVVQQVVL